jgi:hypothetical protein
MIYLSLNILFYLSLLGIVYCSLYPYFVKYIILFRSKFPNVTIKNTLIFCTDRIIDLIAISLCIIIGIFAAVILLPLFILIMPMLFVYLYFNQFGVKRNK